MGKQHDRSAREKLIAFSVSYQRAPLLARGLGLEHLRELVDRLARPLLRKGASIAYGGGWTDTPENFTYALLRLINAEREDTDVVVTSNTKPIGGLISHVAWPHYLDITPTIEAQWIDSCRIIRVQQERAGIAPEAVIHDPQTVRGTDQYLLNGALTLSAMRSLVMRGMDILIPHAPMPEHIPPIHARILMGGKISGYRGFMPGVLEEALVTLEHNVPLYVLGGFGGAAETLARMVLEPLLPEELTLGWQEHHTPELTRINAIAPPGARSSRALLEALAARRHLGLEQLNTGLSEDETRELLTTCDIDRAVHLVRQGLRNRLGITMEPLERN